MAIKENNLDPASEAETKWAPMNFSVDEKFLASLKNVKNSLELPRSAKLTPAQTEQVLSDLQQKYKLKRDQVITILTILFQQGGTARKCDGNLTVKIFNEEIKLSEVRSSLRKAGLKNAERKLARTLGTTLYLIAERLELPGNLAKKVQKNYPDVKFSPSELAWLSDFQSDNEECPGPLKTYIIECFKSQSGQRDQSNKQQHKKTGK